MSTLRHPFRLLIRSLLAATLPCAIVGCSGGPSVNNDPIAIPVDLNQAAAEDLDDETRLRQEQAAQANAGLTHYLQGDAPENGSDPDAIQIAAKRRPRHIQWNSPSGPQEPSTPPTDAASPASVGTLATAEFTFPNADRSVDVETDQSTSNPDEPNIAATTLEPDRLRLLIVELTRELGHTASYSDMPLRELLMIVAMTMVTPDREIDTESFPDLTEDERELLEHMQAFFVSLGKELDGQRDPEDVILAAIDSLRGDLQTEPELTIPEASLCREVRGFGDYDEFKPAESERITFVAGADQPAILYVEVNKFTSELNAKGVWTTELSQRFIIYSESDGLPAWREHWQDIVDETRKRRTDFYTTQTIRIPSNLTLGRYTLKVQLRDDNSGAQAEIGIPFDIVADPKLASPSAALPKRGS